MKHTTWERPTAGPGYVRLVRSLSNKTRGVWLFLVWNLRETPQGGEQTLHCVSFSLLLKFNVFFTPYCVWLGVLHIPFPSVGVMRFIFKSVAWYECSCKIESARFMNKVFSGMISLRRIQLSPYGICYEKSDSGTGCFFPQFFSFPLSVSFHHCCVLIHSSTTHAVQCFAPNTSVFPCQYHFTIAPL
jgi:hypothetical protein